MATHSSILAWRIPMDRGAWWATVYGVTKSQTRLHLTSITSPIFSPVYDNLDVGTELLAVVHVNLLSHTNSCCLVTKLCLTLLQPHGLQPSRLLCPWGLPGKNAGVGCYFLLQGIFLTQGSTLCLLHWQVDSLPHSHQGSHTKLPYYISKQIELFEFGCGCFRKLYSCSVSLESSDEPQKTCIPQALFHGL